MKTILVIEDEVQIRENICQLLRLAGYTATPAAGGLEALRVANDGSPDLILCDVMMAGMDGYEFLRQIRNIPVLRNIPVIFLTARSGSADMRAGMGLGADDYLTKPFRREDLLSAIETRLARSRSVREEIDQRVQSVMARLGITTSHEFNTPLNGVLLLSEILYDSADRLLPDDIRSIGEAIRGSGNRLKRMCENLIWYQQLSQPRIDVPGIEAGYACVGQEFFQSIGRQMPTAHERLQDLQVQAIPGRLRSPEGSVKKMAEEILDNAFKFSRMGEPVIVSGTLEGAQYILDVSNCGDGMTLEEMQRIGPFVQFNRENNEQQGLGLGLFIARSLAMRDGGYLAFSVSEGNLFHAVVHLPLAE